MKSSLAIPQEARVASTEEIRSHFPALERRHRGRPVAYFDGPGGTQVPRAVVDGMMDYLLHHNANTHWRYPSSQETDAMIEGARQAMADLLGADPSEVAFGANMTTLTFHFARGLGRGWGPGDEIVVTELDHHANIAPWRALERDRGVTVRTVPMIPDTGQLDWEALGQAISRKPRLLAIGAASNALGTITDVGRAAAMARDAGTLTFVDAVHYAPHRLVDVRVLGCDFLACSAYKFYGPHVGVLYGRSERLAVVDVPKLEPAPETAPERLETGTLNHEGIAGAAAAVEFLASLAANGGRRERLRTAFGELHLRGQALLERLVYGLSAIDGVRVYGAPASAPRTPTVAFTVGDHPADSVADALADEAVFVSTGDFYATTVVKRYGLGPKGGLVRAGCAAYTTADEVERLVEGVARVAGRRGN
ncbi:MAG TPA: cysteine desulfurase-like protein [Gemmatimonadales bacterium]|nr:cysteine desulfurase-like protein [Gemmatimonadales bacterium]